MQGIITLRYQTTKLCIVQHFNVWNKIFINNISSLNLRNLFRWHKKNFQKIALQFPLGSRAKVVSLTDDRFPTAHELWKLQDFAPHEVVLHNDFSVSHKPHTDRWRSLQQPKTPWLLMYPLSCLLIQFFVSISVMFWSRLNTDCCFPGIYFTFLYAVKYKNEQQQKSITTFSSLHIRH